MSDSTPIRTIDCAEFQEQLPELFANAKGGRLSDDPIYAKHLGTCPTCAASRRACCTRSSRSPSRAILTVPTGPARRAVRAGRFSV